MGTIQTGFGCYPHPLNLRVGSITIETRPDLAQIVADVEANEGIEKGWIYAPLERVRNLSGDIRTLPYPHRVFGLPKTHILEHGAADGDDHIEFLIWALSFFTGMRLTATEAGFVDATPIAPGKLFDFFSTNKNLERAIEFADAFWIKNATAPKRAKLWSAAVHALFLSQNPRLLQFEEFMLLYTAFDTCFALAKEMHPPANGRVLHAERIAWMCRLFAMPIPAWADPTAPAGPEIAILRNATIHEALFVDKPLGFALHGVGTGQNLTVEMEGLICRFLVALIAGPTNYVRFPVNTYQMYGSVFR